PHLQPRGRRLRLARGGERGARLRGEGRAVGGGDRGTRRMSRTQRLWAVYGTLGVLCAAVALALVLTSDHEDNPIPTIVLGEVLGLSFVFAWILGAARRPGHGPGPIPAPVRFTFFAAALG